MGRAGPNEVQKWVTLGHTEHKAGSETEIRLNN